MPTNTQRQPNSQPFRGHIDHRTARLKFVFRIEWTLRFIWDRCFERRSGSSGVSDLTFPTILDCDIDRGTASFELTLSCSASPVCMGFGFHRQCIHFECQGIAIFCLYALLVRRPFPISRTAPTHEPLYNQPIQPRPTPSECACVCRCLVHPEGSVSGCWANCR